MDAPFLSIWREVMLHLTKTTPEPQLQTYQRSWQDTMGKSTVESECRCGSFALEHHGPSRARKLPRETFKFCVYAGRNEGLEVALMRTLAAEGAEAEVGTAPRGSLERDAAGFLEQLL